MARHKTLKERHPLYNSWIDMKRARTRGGCCDEWQNNFYLFVKDVGGVRPDGCCLQRLDKSKVFSRDNFEWKKLNTRNWNESKKEAHRRYQRQYRAKDPLRYKGYDLKRYFGITLDDYNTLLKKQKGVCAICKQEDRYGYALSVDHCHKTNEIRGLLCSDCNRAIGLLCDSTENLKNAIKYLQG